MPAGSACRCEHLSPQIKSLYKLFGGVYHRENSLSGTTAKATHPSRSLLASAHTPSGSNRATACTRSTSARCLRFSWPREPLGASLRFICCSFRKSAVCIALYCPPPPAAEPPSVSALPQFYAQISIFICQYFLAFSSDRTLKGADLRRAQVPFSHAGRIQE